MSKRKSIPSNSQAYMHFAPPAITGGRTNGLPLSQARANARKALSRQSFINANFMTAEGGEYGLGDRTAMGYLPRYTGNPYDSNNFLFRWQQYCHLYETSWEAKKIINIPVDDALRKDWIVEGIPQTMIDFIDKETERLRFKEQISKGMKLERLLGGCINFFGIESKADRPEDPYVAKKDRQKVRFINTVPVSRIAKPQWDSNPLSEGYMRARSYMINGQEVHVSRCIIWDGEPLLDPYDMSLLNFRINQSGFGPSKLAPIWDDIQMAIGVRNAAYQMTKTNNALIAAVEGLQDLQGTSSGRKALQKVKDIANMISVYRAAVVDGENVNFSNLSASFGSVPELIIIYLQVLSAASDIPATRFLGQAPGGLNATGESDLENYYNVIDSLQMRRIDPAIRRFYDLICYPKFGDQWHKERENLDIKYPPLWNLSELEEADRNTKIIDNLIKMYEMGVIDAKQFKQEVDQRGLFTFDVFDNYEDDLTNGTDPTKEDQPKTIDQLKQELSGLKSFFVSNSDPVSKLISLAGGDPKKIDREQFLKGMKVEHEHDDVTGGDEITTAKIVLAHLSEKDDYYTRLEKVENGSSSAKIMPPNPIPDLKTLVDPVREIRKHTTQKTKAESGVSQITSTGTSTEKDTTTKHENKIDLEIFDDPTPAQIEAGNYRKHHIKIHGLDISVENPKGSIRRGVDPDGTEWETELPAHYGYVKRTEGNDGDHVDVYIGDDEDSETVYIVNQHELDSDKFDEHKCILGARTWDEARNIYEAGFSDGTGPRRYESITELTIDEFKDWLKNGEMGKPYKIQNKKPFKEEEHPRDKGGQFSESSSSGGSKSKTEKKAQKPKPKTSEISRTKEDAEAFKQAESMGIKIPPAWNNIWINPDKNGKILVKGKDQKGRSQAIYSAAAVAERDVKKFKRLRDFTADHKAIMDKINSDFEEKDEAKALYLINKTGFRIGSDKDTGAEKQAYGASTLTGKHIKVDGDKIQFDFVGKKGVVQKHVVEDKKLAGYLSDKQGSDANLFNTSGPRIRKYLKTTSGKNYKPKDFRTYVATATAIREVSKIDPPKNEKEKAKKILEVAKIVSSKLGNTPAMARDSYIDPTVFNKWEV